jgi:hypothetical protein
VSSLLLAAAEPSKVPFYVAGLLFVAWSVAVATFGLTQPEFPYSKTGQRAVMLVGLLLAAASVGTAIATA